MAFDPDKHHRRSIRLKGRDYSQPGAYFVTICTRDRACLFGDVVNGEMRLNGSGETARRCWEDIPDHFPLVELDAFVIMPNHMHGIIVIQGRGEKSFAPTFAPTSTAPTTTITVENDRFNRSRVQNRCDEMVPGKHRPTFHLATELPRTRCSKRGRTGGHPRIHPGQSRPLERGREQSRLAELQAMNCTPPTPTSIRVPNHLQML